MTTTHSVSDYKKLITPLLEDDLSPATLNDNILELHELFSQINGITGHQKGLNNQHLNAIDKQSAISANGAARCFKEKKGKRTLYFLKAVTDAIAAIRKKKPGKTVHILYAGCGPYATFFTLIAPLYPPEVVQFTLVEINEVSYDYAQRLINGLDLSAYLKAFDLADAITYQVKDGDQFDMLISETINMGLKDEPLVAILLNLLPQLPDDIIVLPENVYLDVMLVKQSDIQSGAISELRHPGSNVPCWRKRIFNLQTAITDRQPVQHFPTVRLTPPDLKEYDYLVIYTIVQVYQDHVVGTCESDFTELLVYNINEEEKQKTNLELTYYLYPNPELSYKFT